MPVRTPASYPLRASALSNALSLAHSYGALGTSALLLSLVLALWPASASCQAAPVATPRVESVPGLLPPPALELQAVDARLGTISRGRPSLAGPIVVTAAGGGIAVISGFAGLIVWGISGMDRAWNGSEERAIERHSTQALLGIFAGGLLVAAPGLAWMALRLRHRRAYSNEHAEELRTLKRRRGELRQQLRVGFSLEPRQVGLRLHTTF